nr:hypothetical protein HK105_004053 [Polyrhizophydium stewartii]
MPARDAPALHPASRPKQPLLKHKASAPAVLAAIAPATGHSATAPKAAPIAQPKFPAAIAEEEFNNSSLEHILNSTTSRDLDGRDTDRMQSGSTAPSAAKDARSMGPAIRRSTLGAAQLVRPAAHAASAAEVPAASGRARMALRDDFMAIKRTSLFAAPLRVPKKHPSTSALSASSGMPGASGASRVGSSTAALLADREMPAAQAPVVTQPSQAAQVPVTMPLPLPFGDMRPAVRSLGQASRTPVAHKTAAMPFTPRARIHRDLVRELGMALMETTVAASPARATGTLHRSTSLQFTVGGSTLVAVDSGAPLSTVPPPLPSAMNAVAALTAGAPSRDDAQPAAVVLAPELARGSVVTTTAAQREPSPPAQPAAGHSKPRVPLPNPFDVLGIAPRTEISLQPPNTQGGGFVIPGVGSVTMQGGAIVLSAAAGTSSGAGSTAASSSSTSPLLLAGTADFAAHPEADDLVGSLLVGVDDSGAEHIHMQPLPPLHMRRTMSAGDVLALGHMRSRDAGDHDNASDATFTDGEGDGEVDESIASAHALRGPSHLYNLHAGAVSASALLTTSKQHYHSGGGAGGGGGGGNSSDEDESTLDSLRSELDALTSMEEQLLREIEQEAVRREIIM